MSPPVDSSSSTISPSDLYNAIIYKYENNLCTFDQLVTYSLRASTQLLAANIPDPGITSFFTESFMRLVRVKEEKIYKNHKVSRNDDAHKSNLNDQLVSDPCPTGSTDRAPTCKLSPENISIKSPAACENKMPSINSCRDVSNDEPIVNTSISVTVDDDDIEAKRSNVYDVSFFHRTNCYEKSGNERNILADRGISDVNTSMSFSNSHVVRSKSSYNRKCSIAISTMSVIDPTIVSRSSDMTNVIVKTDTDLTTREPDDIERDALASLTGNSFPNVTLKTEVNIKRLSTNTVNHDVENAKTSDSNRVVNPIDKEKDRAFVGLNDDQDEDLSSLTKIILPSEFDVTNKILAPAYSSNIDYKDIDDFVHLAPMNYWLVSSAVELLMKSYVRFHHQSQAISTFRDEFPITSFIVVTDETCYNKPLIKIMTKQNMNHARSIHYPHLIDYYRIHYLKLNYILRCMAKNYTEVVIQYDNDSTFCAKMTSGYRELRVCNTLTSRHLRVLTTIHNHVDKSFIFRENFTIYEKVELQLAGYNNPMYHIDGFAITMKRDGRIVSDLDTDIFDLSLASSITLSKVFK